LELLISSTCALLAEYQSSQCCTGAASTDNFSIFLSHLCLDEYHAANQHYAQELVGFTKKQFFEVSNQLQYVAFITGSLS